MSLVSKIQLWLSQVYLYVIAGSVALNVLLMAGCYIQGLRMHSAKVELKAEKTSHKNDIENYKQAQKTAEALAQAAKKEQESRYDELQHEGDAQYADLRRQFDAALLHLKVVKGTSLKPDLSTSATAPGSPDGTSTDPLIPTPLSDLGICAENTAKALVAQQWIKKLEDIH